jgi:polyisoprenoid-binding protein YceI
MTKSILLVLLVTIFPGTVQTPTRTYRIVDAQSRFTILVGKAGFLSSAAHDHTIAVKAFTGRVTVNAGTNITGASMELDIDARSLKVADQDVSEKDRAEIQSEMETKVLEVSRFPRITFKSVSLSGVKADAGNWRFTLDGDLSLHGVTKRVAVPVTATVKPEQLNASGEVTIKQTDFGIKVYSKALGAVKVQDALKLSFNIIARP